MEQGWRKLDKGVWGKANTSGVDFLVEESINPSTSEVVCEAAVLTRSGCCGQPVKRIIGQFSTREEAIHFLDQSHLA